MPVHRYKELDALRGIAALLVVFFHFTMNRTQAALGFNLGITGVDLFFIISGFVIYMSLNNVSSGSEFVINRFTRLFPTYWTCVTITFVGQIFLKLAYNVITIEQISFAQYLPNMTMLQYYLKIPDLDGPYWTMIIELLFYGFMLSLYKVKILKLELFWIFGVLFFCLFYAVFLKTNYFSFYQIIDLYFPLIHHFPLFLAGIIFYKILTADSSNEKIAFYIFLFFAFITQILLLQHSNRWQPFISFSQYLIMLSIYFSVFILFVNNKLGFIINPFTLFFGRISFALYLIHQFFSIDIIIPYLLKHTFFGFWIATAIALVSVVFMATLITYYVEIPFGKKWNKLLKSIFKIV